MIRLLVRDMRLSVRHGGDTVAALLFFVLVAALFPLAIGPAPETLGRIAPGVIWVAALLAALLPLDRLLGADLEDGSLDLLLLSGLHPAAIAAGKAAAHWLVTGLPLLVAAAPLALMLRMPEAAVPALLAGLLPGTLAFSLLGTAAAALVLGARRGGVLMPLLIPSESVSNGSNVSLCAPQASHMTRLTRRPQKKEHLGLPRRWQSNSRRPSSFVRNSCASS